MNCNMEQEIANSLSLSRGQTGRNTNRILGISGRPWETDDDGQVLTQRWDIRSREKSENRFALAANPQIGSHRSNHPFKPLHSLMRSDGRGGRTGRVWDQKKIQWQSIDVCRALIVEQTPSSELFGVNQNVSY